VSAPSTIRVLIADDSAVSRRVLADLVAGDTGIEVVASVKDGKAAVTEAARLQPDVVLMDVLMPVMDGLNATRSLMQETPCRIILVSELVGREADLNFRALEAGALDLMRKPSREEVRDGEARAVLLRKIRTYARVPVVRRHRRKGSEPLATRASDEPTGMAAQETAACAPPSSRVAVPGEDALVCIGASTGGPPAIRTVLAAMDVATGPPLLIAQHMSEGFIRGMAAWLDGQLEHLRVSVARAGETPVSGHAYLAPDDAHLQYTDGRFRVIRTLAGVSYRPSVDVLFESVARTGHARRCIAALLTGMGDDGARGLLALRTAGAHTLAQDEASSTVYGMPRAAHALGAASETLPIEEIGLRIRGLVTDTPVRAVS